MHTVYCSFDKIDFAGTGTHDVPVPTVKPPLTPKTVTPVHESERKNTKPKMFLFLLILTAL